MAAVPPEPLLEGGGTSPSPAVEKKEGGNAEDPLKIVMVANNVVLSLFLSILNRPDILILSHVKPSGALKMNLEHILGVSP